MRALVRAIPRFAAFPHQLGLAASLLVACAPAPALRHGAVPMPLESPEATSSSPPPAVATLFGTRGCLGALVARRWVLTAAHCVVDARHSHVRLGHGARRMPLAISRCLVHPRAYGAPTACEAAPARPLDTAHDLALLELAGPVPSDVARPLPILLGAGRRFVGTRLLVVSAHATEWQSAGPWRVCWHRVQSLRSGRLGTRALAGQPLLGTRPGDSGGPALLDRAGALVVVGALSGGRTLWSPDSRYAATFTPANARWLRATLARPAP